MGNNNYQDWDDDEDDFDFDEEPKQKRSNTNDDDLVKQLRRAQRASEKRAKELESELLGLRSERRKSTVESLLAERGLNTKVAKFIPNDLDVNAESLSAWLEENGDVFGIHRQEQAQPDLTQLRQIDNVTANAQIPAGGDDLMLRLQQAGSADEIINMIFSADQ